MQESMVKYSLCFSCLSLLFLSLPPRLSGSSSLPVILSSESDFCCNSAAAVSLSLHGAGPLQTLSVGVSVGVGRGWATIDLIVCVVSSRSLQ